MKPPEQLLSEALVGGELCTAGLPGRVPQAWKFWSTNEGQWAVFPIVGEHISKTDEDGVRAARQNGLLPVFVASNFEAIKAIAPHYRQLRPNLICEVAGRGHLIPRPSFPRRRRPPNRSKGPRIRGNLLAALVRERGASVELRSALSSLAEQYRSFRRRSHTDEAEEVALLQYAHRLLDQMGLRKDQMRAAQMVRTLERGGLGARRDHFFHSFQNYFLGLLAILRLAPQFDAYRRLARLDWQVDPCNVWFLTSMWHDVGYPFQKVGSIVNATMGYELPEDWAIDLKEQFLSHPDTVSALRDLSSLLAHLTDPAGVRTAWMGPRPKSNLGVRGNGIQSALSENIRQSHGAYGGVRLIRDYSADLDKMDDQPSAALLRQTVLLASCSIPFHDWFFRDSMRRSCGQCRIATVVLPFAALLAFIDSIQDDRRGLAADERATVILEKLLVRRPATVSARINFQAVADDQLLGKIVEANDVLAMLDQRMDTLHFEYPRWMAKSLT